MLRAKGGGVLIVATIACFGFPHSSSQATPDSRGSSAPASSGDEPIRDVLAYSTDGPSDVVLVDVPSGRSRVVLGGPRNAFDPDVSPDGRIAYRVNPDPSDDAGAIWVADADGTGATNLTRAPDNDNWSPAWTPDASRIAFASARGGLLNVWTMAKDGTDLVQVTTGEGEYPDWSPDGRQIVFAGASTGGSYDVFVVEASGGPVTQLTDEPGTDFAPAWSPDGSRIAFDSERDGDWAVFVMDSDGSNERRVASPGAFATWLGPDDLAYVGPGGIVVLRLS